MGGKGEGSGGKGGGNWEWGTPYPPPLYYAKNLSVHRNWFSKFVRYSLSLSKNLEPNE